MLKPILDHLVLDVHDDMDAAAARYRELGFTLTERGFHTLGSINHLAMFATDYLELLGWPATGTGRAELRGFPRGLNGLVFKTDDADETYNYLKAVGLEGDFPRSFSRPVMVGGEQRDAKFRTVSVAQQQLGRIYFCEHLTPELVWRPEWQRHANGVTVIDSVVVTSAEAPALAELFRSLFGGWLAQGHDRHVLNAGRAKIEIVAGDGPSRMTTLRLAGRAAAPVEAEHVRLEFLG